MPYDLATHADLVGLAAHALLSWQHLFARARATRMGLSNDRCGGAYALDSAATRRRRLAELKAQIRGIEAGGLMAPASPTSIVLGQDRQHVTLGRAALPNANEIAVENAKPTRAA